MRWVLAAITIAVWLWLVGIVAIADSEPSGPVVENTQTAPPAVLRHPVRQVYP